MKMKFFIFHILLLIPLFIFAESQNHERAITWKGVQQINIDENENLSMLRFSGSHNEFADGFLPSYFERFPLESQAENLGIELRNKIFEVMEIDEMEVVSGNQLIQNDLKLNYSIAYDKKKPFATLSFIPIRINEITGMYEKLVSFTVEIKYDLVRESGDHLKSMEYAENSVLSSGNWYKVAVNKTGVHIISYQQLNELGINPGTINPKNIRVYGNGGGMLPESVSGFRYDDLQENAILVSGEDDGVFNESDYILFYGESPNEWKYSEIDTKMHNYPHLYADYNYYYLTADLGIGKRIQTQPSSNLEPTFISTKYNDAYHYEPETQNLIGTGRMWYGETFDLSPTLIKELNFPDIDLSSKVHFDVDLAARSSITSSFSISINNVGILTVPIPATSSSNINADYAKTKFDSTSFNPSGSALTLKIAYNKSTPSSLGFLNFFTLNVVRNLSYNNVQMVFRDVRTAGIDGVVEYRLSKVTSSVSVWNVSDRINPTIVETVNSSSQ